MKTDFTPNTIDINAQTIADMLPGGNVFNAKNIDGSNMRKMLTALAYELTRTQNKIYEVSVEDDLEQTTNLIEQWESALGIPDECFSNDPHDVSLAQRRKQITAKFAKMNLVTEADWITLASYFDIKIQIIHPIANNGFDYTFDFYFFDDKSARYTMIIKFMGMSTPEDIFDCTFDFSFSADNILICLFNHLKPANVELIFEYEF